jgi:hypothetical protein
MKAIKISTKSTLEISPEAASFYIAIFIASNIFSSVMSKRN